MRRRKKSNEGKVLIVIAGLNASGKSALAVALAKKCNGEVISADSRQVYQGLNIGSGKITKKEMGGIPHHLLDVASPKRTFTVARYQKLAWSAMERIWKRGNLPILCGGTGLYLRAAVDGLVIPAVKPNAELRRKLAKKPVAELFKMLERKDPARAATIEARNPRRLIRALEIVEALGKVPKLAMKPLKARVLILGIKKEEAEMRRRIALRLKKRLAAGMAEEVKRLHARGLSWKRLEDFGLEYRYVAFFLQNKIKKEDLFPLLLKAILRYAKRQITWFKKDKRIKWIAKPAEAVALAEKFLK
ncbi:MAG: tRNA (adenosine(37)-N6)-dimethylallyltransferase MiaA [Candidatus Jorgensenbacteria bacterium]